MAWRRRRSKPTKTSWREAISRSGDDKDRLLQEMAWRRHGVKPFLGTMTTKTAAGAQPSLGATTAKTCYFKTWLGAGMAAEPFFEAK